MSLLSNNVFDLENIKEACTAMHDSGTQTFIELHLITQKGQKSTTYCRKYFVIIIAGKYKISTTLKYLFYYSFRVYELFRIV